MANSVFSEALRFFTDYYPDFDYFEWASNKAYLDMNRTLRFKKKTDRLKGEDLKKVTNKRNVWKKQGTNAISNSFQRINSEPFDDWHKKTCQKLIDIYSNDQKKLEKNLTFGQAQKWLNMTLKYIWLLGELNMLNPEDAQTIKSIEKDLHVPLDSYLLRYAAGKNVGDQGNGLSSNIIYDKENPDFQQWSNIDDWDKYLKYQKTLKAAISDGSNPIEWELRHWHKALKIYD